MWVDDNPVEGGYIFMHMLWLREIHLFELQIEKNF